MFLNGAKRSHQRFEQCLRLLDKNASPLLKALEAQSLFDAEIQKSAAEMAIEAVREYKAEVMLKVEDESVRNRILEKINLIQLIVMFPDDVLNTTKINDFYNDIELDGTEAFIKMYVDFVSYANSIEREPNDSWIKVLTSILKLHLKMYHKEMNIFCTVL